MTGVLDNLGLDLANCRGQSYDNGSNMRGVQALVQQKYPEALFISTVATVLTYCYVMQLLLVESDILWHSKKTVHNFLIFCEEAVCLTRVCVHNP